MKTVYFSADLPSYKANLHCHTTCSDGKLTPEQIKEAYLAHGYSIVAYSDHNVLIDHSDLNDEKFLAMLATEYNVHKPGDRHPAFLPTYHINFYPRRSHQVTVPCYTPGAFSRADLLAVQPHTGEDYVRSYDGVQDMIDRFNAAGFITMINHPTWSLQTAADFLRLHGFFAIELYNHGCASVGFDEYNTAIWDQLLRAGMPVYGTATDDNHNGAPLDDPANDSFGGFTVIQAAALTQEAVVEALEAGHFYASTGPLFRSIELEDDILKVECSPVEKILLTTGHRQARITYPEPGEEALTCAEFDLHSIKANDYVRLTLVDAEGRFAWSQPIRDYIGKE